MAQYNIDVSLLETLSVTGVGTTPVVLDMGKLRVNPQITSGGLYLSSNDTPVTAVAGDDVTILGSVDGVHYFDLGATGATIAYGLDDNGIILIEGNVRYLKFTAAQVQGSEYYKMHIVVSANHGKG